MSAIVERQPQSTSRRNQIIGWAVVVILLGLFAYSVQDWHQLWKVASAPDNIPIVAMLFLVPFFTWLGIKQAKANDRLIVDLEGDKDLAKSHHRKAEPWRPGWAKDLHVWPYLVRIEFLAAVIVTVVLYVWSITLNAPLEEPANPNLTMNPSKAPWYFLGLQEMLVYFDPWIAGVVMPSIIMIGLMVFPYVDSNPLGNGYYTFRQRRFSFVLLVVSCFYIICALFLHWLMTGDCKWVSLRPLRLCPQNEFEKKLLARTSILQYVTFQFFASSVLLALPVKLILRLALTIKYF